MMNCIELNYFSFHGKENLKRSKDGYGHKVGRWEVGNDYKDEALQCSHGVHWQTS